MEATKNSSPIGLFTAFARRIALAAGTKYFLVFIFAAVWMVFFDRFNLLSQMKVRKQITELQADAKFYEEGIERLDFEREQMFTNREELERFARERYLMRKPGEDVFVVVE